MGSARSTFAALAAAVLVFAAAAARAETADTSAAAEAADAKSQAELDAIQHDIDAMRAKLNASKTAQTPASQVDRAVENKYGPDASATTRSGKLTVSGLIQVWYTAFQSDNRALFDNPSIPVPDTNDASDNDSFRIRRTELKFTMDIHENITAVLMIDPANEATGFPGFPDNQASGTQIFKRVNNVAPEFLAAGNIGSTAAVGAVQQGIGQVPRLLQDAYIDYHGLIPHHDLQVGQFLPPVGEEALRDNGQLDFVERSLVGQVGYARDLGAQVHGRWWDDRVQYWAGMFDGAGNYLFSAGQLQNRSNDNSQFDFASRVLVRPLWQGPDGVWGRLEMGASYEFGTHGKDGGTDPLNTPTSGLDMPRTSAYRTGAWLYYAPHGPVKGLWLRSEFAQVRDRNTPGAVIDLTGSGTIDGGAFQGNPQPLTVYGWNASLGYRLGDSRYSDISPAFLRNLEFDFRYEAFQNVMTANLVSPQDTDVFQTRIFTSGINYYVCGNNAKIQANFNQLWNPSGGIREFHNVRDDSFALNFQVAF